jgi:hypothetical protein
MMPIRVDAELEALFIGFLGKVVGGGQVFVDWGGGQVFVDWGGGQVFVDWGDWLVLILGLGAVGAGTNEGAEEQKEDSIELHAGNTRA